MVAANVAHVEPQPQVTVHRQDRKSVSSLHVAPDRRRNAQSEDKIKGEYDRCRKNLVTVGTASKASQLCLWTNSSTYYLHANAEAYNVASQLNNALC